MGKDNENYPDIKEMGKNEMTIQRISENCNWFFAKTSNIEEG